MDQNKNHLKYRKIHHYRFQSEEQKYINQYKMYLLFSEAKPYFQQGDVMRATLSRLQQLQTHWFLLMDGIMKDLSVAFAAIIHFLKIWMIV